MAKVQIKSEKLTPFGGIFSIMEQFDALLAQTIDSTLGLADDLIERKGAPVVIHPKFRHSS